MIIKENVAYWCRTEALAEKFLQECKKQKIYFMYPESNNYWDVYKQHTVYMYLEYDNKKILYYTNTMLCHIHNIKIVEYKSTLKSLGRLRRNNA